MTFLDMARFRRLSRGMDRLVEGVPVIEAQTDAGYESSSGDRPPRRGPGRRAWIFGWRGDAAHSRLTVPSLPIRGFRRQVAISFFRVVQLRTVLVVIPAYRACDGAELIRILPYGADFGDPRR